MPVTPSPVRSDGRGAKASAARCVDIRPTGRRIADADLRGIAPEIEVWVRPGAEGSGRTGDGTVADLAGDRLRVRGPRRDVVVVADGRRLQRRRGGDLTFDLSSAVERRLPGAFDTAALTRAEAADRTTGIRHRYRLTPNPPSPGEPATVHVDADPASRLAGGTVSWAATSADSAVPRSGTAALQASADGTHATAEIPGHPDGSVVRYRITASTRDGEHVPVTDAGPDYALHRPGLPYVRPPAIDFSYAVGHPELPSWWSDAVVYHLLLDRFAGPEGTAVDATAVAPLGFAGGTIAGATARLDHVAALGATAVLVSPWHRGDMHVCYDVIDHTAVDERLGTADDVRSFLDRAHAFGMRVVLDIEVSYLGAGHPQAIAATADPNGADAGWVVTHDGRPLGWFGGNPTFLPVDHSHPEARRELIDALRHWLEAGVDGFRFDSAHAASFDFWTDVGAAVRSANPDAVTIAEATRDRAFCHTFRGRLTGFLDFPLERALRDFAAGRSTPSAVEEAAAASDATPPGLARGTFVECHDDDRLSHVVGGDHARVHLGLLLLLCLPGTPILYYGTEVGLTQPGPGDCDLMVRLPMPWGAGDAGELAWTQAAVALRRSHPALRTGPRVPLLADDSRGVWAFARTAPPEHAGAGAVVVAANNSDRPATVELDLSILGGPARLTLLAPPAAAIVAPGPTFAPVELP